MTATPIARRLHRSVAVVHNGIIENFAALRHSLEHATMN